MEEFIGHIEKSGLVFVPATQRQRELYFASLKIGQSLTERLSLYRPQKTNQQVRTIMGYMIDQAIIQANELGIDSSEILAFLVDGSIPKGSPVTKDLLHILMYLICPTVDENGRRTTLSNMDTQQAARLFETFRTVLAPLGIVIQDPDPNLRTR